MGNFEFLLINGRLFILKARAANLLLVGT